MKEINCPHVGWSGGCDDCTLGLEPITCQEIETDMEYFNDIETNLINQIRIDTK